MAKNKRSMAMKNYYIHANKKKWIKRILAGVVTVALAVGFAITLTMTIKNPTKAVGASAYTVGAIDDSGKTTEAENAIYTKDTINVDGLRCKVADDAKITYRVYFYKENGELAGATKELSTDLTDDLIPGEAVSARIVITPTADEDGKISTSEKYEYAKQLTVVSFKD
jgi:hypothetical protein